MVERYIGFLANALLISYNHPLESKFISPNLRSSGWTDSQSLDIRLTSLIGHGITIPAWRRLRIDSGLVALFEFTSSGEFSLIVTQSGPIGRARS